MKSGSKGFQGICSLLLKPSYVHTKISWNLELLRFTLYKYKDYCSLSVRENFVYRWSKFSHILAILLACMVVHSLIVELDYSFSIALVPQGVRLLMAKYEMGLPDRLQSNEICDGRRKNKRDILGLPRIPATFSELSCNPLASRNFPASFSELSLNIPTIFLICPCNFPQYIKFSFELHHYLI